jgi:hypothetical protein
MTTTENVTMTIEVTVAKARALFGCPAWCTTDHDAPVPPEPGEHVRALGGDRSADSVDLEDAPWAPHPVVSLWIGGNAVESDLPATRDGVERLPRPGRDAPAGSGRAVRAPPQRRARRTGMSSADKVRAPTSALRSRPRT